MEKDLWENITNEDIILCPIRDTFVKLLIWSIDEL